MLAEKPIMGWNSWNTFGNKINEQLIMEIADALVEKGYKDAGYEYVIIDDCWSLKRRQNGKLVANPEMFPHGIKYLSDYIHSKGLKFGMYSCAGVMTCEGYPSSYGYEFEDAEQFARWGVDYLKYDFCNFPQSADVKNAYLTMAMALRNCGRDIVFAACNWGVEEPWNWMRSRGAHTYRSTRDIYDNKNSFLELFDSQIDNIGNNGPGCYNDIDMLIVGMHGNGNVGLGGCTSEEYFMHFAMWAFVGSPLIIGGDIRNMDKADEEILLNKGLISINQDPECRPAFLLNPDKNHGILKFMKLLDKGRFAYAAFNPTAEVDWKEIYTNLDDFGIHSNGSRSIRITDAITGKDLGVYKDGFHTPLNNRCGIFICEVIED